MPSKVAKENIQVQVGAFIAVGVLLFLMAIFMLGSKYNVLQRHYRLICYFDKVSGLRVGAPVHLAGINVGFIDAISFEDIEGQVDHQKKIITKVKLVLKIDQRYQDRIRSDSSASIETQGLLGDRMVFLTVGSLGATVLKNNDKITDVLDPAGFNQLVFESNELITKAKKFLDNTNGFVSNTNDLVSKFNTVMDEVTKGKGLAHEIIYSQDNQAFASLNDILVQFDQMSRNLVSVTNKINTGRGTLGALVNDDSLYQDIKTLLGKANRNKLVRAVIRYTLKTKDKQSLK